MSVTVTTPPRVSEKRREIAPAISNHASPRWLPYYYAVQIACQLALLISSLSAARIFFRTSAFGMSLAALALTAGRNGGRRHPAAKLALAVFAILVVEALHPETGSAIGAFATLAMYVAILGPLFWVPRLALDVMWFRRVVLMIWVFQSLSALVGALQVYYPGSFQPALASVLSDNYLSSLKITLSNGERIIRPTGLTDTPGGAAAAGTYAILLALGLWTDRPRVWLRAVLALSIGVGMFVLYLCQIRSLVVMVAISILAMASAHALRGRIRSFAGISIVVGVIAVGAFVAAVAVGGEDVTRRLSTLVDSSPTDVYYTNRGIFLEHTLTELLPQYPLGAGLGRWGMISNYFGGDIPMSSLIYVEIQWTGWLLDGGVLLIFTYATMLGVTLLSVWRVAKTSRIDGRSDLAAWAAMVLGYDVGTIALTFNFPVFMSGFGMDFWLLNAALLAVASRADDAESSLPLHSPS